MTEQELKTKLKKISDDFDQAKKALYIEYAKAQRIFEVGDVIKKNDEIILINRFSTSAMLDLPQPVYIGLSLTKKLEPKKSGEQSSIFGNQGTELIKKSAASNTTNHPTPSTGG